MLKLFGLFCVLFAIGGACYRAYLDHRRQTIERRLSTLEDYRREYTIKAETDARCRPLLDALEAAIAENKRALGDE